MQLDGGVLRAREAAAAKDADGHLEIAAELLAHDIGSYLGLKLETVSRLLSRFQAGGLIQVQGRVVQLLDIAALKQIAGR
jgi:CRP/FNR family transcriptional regulator